MNELYEASLEQREEAGPLDRGELAKLTREFDPETALYLLQATDRAIFGPWKDFDQRLEGCFSLTICDRAQELRLVKEPFLSQARWRWLKEHPARAGLEAANPYWVRRDRHPLKGAFESRYAAIRHPSGRQWLEAREYFQPNEDGWLTWRGIRLAGLAKEGR